MNLISPHISLDLDLDEALEILRGLGLTIVEDNDDGLSYRVDAPDFSMAIYPEASKVASVWYGDPLGRESEEGMGKKVILYLERYGSFENWECRMDNGWMRYWYNPTDKVSMVYGIHNDVIRFNCYSEADD